MLKKTEIKYRKPWPEDCIWPEPLYDGCGMMWEADLVDETLLDEEGQDLMEIMEYYDYLVEDGILDRNYELDPDHCDAEDDEDEFVPVIGEEYWDNNGFDIRMWEDDLTEHMNMLRLDVPKNKSDDPVMRIREIIGYEFINENLLRQAFTRRAFAVEYGLSGCNEELEFLGDSVLNTVVTREIVKHLAEIELTNTDAPFSSKYDEGDMSSIRAGFVSKEHLAERASVLGLDRFILYGTGEGPTESSREDVIEALIGAVTIDSGWDWDAIEDVVDKLVYIQLSDPDRYLKKSFYEIFNSWHQKHFGRIPEYRVYPAEGGRVDCTMRYFVPENDRGVWPDQRVDVWARTRSLARERAAEFAYRFVVSKGLWMDLRNAELVPDYENSINQLQELFQKGYVDAMPEYEITESPIGCWECNCTCAGIAGYGRGSSKTKAKKQAAYAVLERLMHCEIQV